MESTRLGILHRGIQISGLGMKSFQTYESHVPFDLRFMIDCNIVGGNWIEVPCGKYKKMSKPLSYCQLEFDCLYSDFISHDSEGEYSRMAPFRILSFDIECAGRKGHFPEAKHDPVIQVANHVTIQGEHQPFIRNVITLKSCAPIEGVDVISFETERAVLLAWRLAEDIGAAPVWVFNNGISHNDQVETESVMPFVQEAIDGIEFARGDSNSTWGSVRAAMGHPEPFELKYNNSYYRG